MKSRPLESGVRDSYWRATQAELHSLQRRGEIFVLTVVAVLIVSAILARDWYESPGFWLIVASAAFAVIMAEVFFVAFRKRRIAAARGLVCGRCSYMPHDTEISEVADTRRCPRCAGDL